MRTRTKRIMGIQNIRAMAARLLVIAVLALAISAGFVAVDQPSGTSAMPKLNCLDAVKLGQSWQVYGDWLTASGYYVQAATAYAKADSYFGMCDGGQF